jgi:anti-anti-sigma regulatory factor
MLKISISENDAKRQLVLEGKLVEPWTNELKIVGQTAFAEGDLRELTIDLRSVTAISADGEKVLLALMNQGAKFRVCGVFMRQVMKNLSRRLRETKGMRGEDMT